MFAKGFYSVVMSEIASINKDSITGIMCPVYLDRIVVNQYSSFAPELFLAIAIVVIWCY